MKRGIGGLLVVDASPRWLCGHTLLVSRPDSEQRAMAIAHERIAALMQYVADCTDLPRPITAESDQLSRLALDDLRPQTLAVCGVYGDHCVFSAARHLQTECGFQVVILEDACLWSAPLGWLTCRRNRRYYKPDLLKVPRTCATRLWPALLDGDTRELWSGDPPSF